MRRSLVPVILFGLTSCGDSSSTTSSTPANESALSVVIAPTDATFFGHPQFPWAANFIVQLFERSGTGAVVEEIVVELSEPVVFPQSIIATAAGTTRVEGGGRLSIPLSIGLTVNGLVAQVVVRATDDRGVSIEALGRLVVVAAQGP
jgi:hypothetical protein